MSDQISFETPENIEIAYDVAGLGSRFAAWVLDQALVTIFVIVLFFILLIAGVVGEDLLGGFEAPFDENGQPQMSSYVFGFIYLLYSLGSFVYFGLSELFMKGQTVGKRRLGIRVVQSNGFSLNPNSILVRSVFRVADHLPLLWVVPVVTDQQRRLGDMVAGTVVVFDRPAEINELREQLTQVSRDETSFRFANLASRTDENQIVVVERILERLPTVPERQKRELLSRVVTSVCARLEMDVPESSLHEQFLKEFLAAHYRHEYRRLG